MIRIVWFVILVLAAVVLVTPAAVSQNKPQAAAVSPDSALKICKLTFAQNCSGCHGDKAQGTVGPNLTDKYWLHGGGSKNIAKTIKEGISGKGMISWDAVLSASEIQQMSEYVVGLQGTDPPKAKKPEGEPLEERRN
jgi:cytochrome c oxidase cbb3-type subunit 3